jgi:RNA polymerase sigma factor (sigma-70 family)
VTEQQIADQQTGLAAALAADLRAYRAGDRAAATALIRRATPFLWNVVRGIGLDHASAEDAVQNTLLTLVRRSDGIEEPQAVLRWLVVVAQREAYRSARADSRVVPDADAGQDLPAPAGTGPEDVVTAGDLERVLWRNIGRLSDRCRRLLRVIAAGGRPDYAALSEALGIPVGSIGPTRGRCLGKLRALLAADPEWSEA